MGKYIVFLVTPKGLRRIGSKNVLRDAERIGRVYRKVNAKRTGYWGAIVIFKGKKVVETL